MATVAAGLGGTGDRCHTPSGQVPETCTAGGPETPPACTGVKQSGPLAAVCIKPAIGPQAYVALATCATLSRIQ